MAVIGAGVSGLSAAWLLSQAGHKVTLFEKEERLGGHANSVAAPNLPLPVDTGFIVFNEANYPNFTALMAELGVPTQEADMSFAASLQGGRIEYASNDLGAFLGGGRNLLSIRFWSMLCDIVRFYKSAEADVARGEEGRTLGAYLDARGYGEAFQCDHILPMAAAIWSSSLTDMRAYPLEAFVRFFSNHGLLRLANQPKWRTIIGGSGVYVQKLCDRINAEIIRGAPVRQVAPCLGGVDVRDARGQIRRFDRVLIAAHADQALDMLANPDAQQRRLLSAVPYRANRAVLHSDPSFMPRARRAWASWNYVAEAADGGCSITYWMNRLQNLQTAAPLFVTLNPSREPEGTLWDGCYEHPCFSVEALRAQREIWAVQGRGGVWFAGAWLGAGFHEDGLQAGLAAAEAMGGARRPWSVAAESARLALPADLAEAA
ncbi:MAG TPA: FAD-dependent oxidoreductase [Terricaulis sp.]|nr:FAD-dependent oxidoreductase [Terricaulis sp.]